MNATDTVALALVEDEDTRTLSITQAATGSAVDLRGHFRQSDETMEYGITTNAPHFVTPTIYASDIAQDDTGFVTITEGGTPQAVTVKQVLHDQDTRLTRIDLTLTA